MKIKSIAAATVLTAAVVTPIAVTLSSAMNTVKPDKYRIVVASTIPIKTLNKFKSATTGSSDTVIGMFNAGLLRYYPQSESNGGLETTLSLRKLSFGFSAMTDAQMDKILNGTEAEKETIKKDVMADHQFNQTLYNYGHLTTDLAESVSIVGSPSHAIGAQFKIRKNAKFWNGDLVTAEDFEKTILVALDAKNGVPWAWTVYRTLGLLNAQNIWDAQTVPDKDGKVLSFEQALEKYPLGIVKSDEIPLAELSVTPEGAKFFADEYAAGRKRHRKLMYLFGGNNGQRFMSAYAASSLSTPTSTRHFAKVGLDDWGTSVENLMGCGPFKMEYFDLDYKIVSNRWDGYWDRERVISPQIEMRVIPDVSSQIQMFRDGAIGKVTFGSSMLPQFFGDANLKKFVKPTNYREILYYLGFNTKTNNPNAKYLLDENFRNALQYSFDRTQYLRAIAADNAYPAESFTTLMKMTDGKGTGVINNAMDFRNQAGLINTGPFGSTVNTASPIAAWNELYNFPNQPTTFKDDLFTRDEKLLNSHDMSKNNREDRVHNANLSRSYFDQFLKDHPDFNGIELKLMTSSVYKEQITVVKQDIEQNLPGVKVTIVPKPQSVYNQVAASLDWDLRLIDWGYDYLDPWTYYHLVADKVTQTNEDDPIISTRLDRNSSGDGYSLVDYVANKLTEDPSYFAKRFLNDTNQTATINDALAQFIRMEATVGSNDPDAMQWESPFEKGKTIDAFDPAIFDLKPSASNNFSGYAGEFDRYQEFFPHANKWSQTLKNLVANATTKHDLWKNKDYRFQVLYPIIEKMIRDSAIGTPMSRIQNSYIASRLIGEINYAESIRYFGFVYQANHIPPSKYALPGMEALIH